MRQRILSLLFICLTVLTLCFAVIMPATASTPKHYTELTFPPIPAVRPPAYKRFTLKNGLVVYLLEDHELPLVSGSILIRTGERWEPPTQVGLADITAEVMRSGGTLKHPADRFNELLEQNAAAIEISVDDAVASAGFSALSEDLETVLGLFAEVLREPAFPSEKLNLAKQQRKGYIARRNDSPENISNREVKKLVYGKESPYARTIEYQTLNNIQLTDLQSFHQRYFDPSRMILGIIGDFNPIQMRQLIERHLGNWSVNTPALAQPPLATPEKKGGVYIVDQPQLTQSSVTIAQMGGKLSDPNVFALYVLNEALNGFGGRLFDEVRSRQGLAYSVYAVWSPRFDYPGLFLAGGQTQSETTVPFIQAILAELEKVRQQPLTPKELAFAKESILNSFVFNFADPSQNLLRLMRYEYYGYSQDFLARYQQSVKEMTAQKVLAAAQQTLKPEEMVTLVVGNRRAIKPQLEALQQTVTPLDIAISIPDAA
jgi:zinc protease